MNVTGPILLGKEGMVSDLVASNIVDVDRRMGGSAGECLHAHVMSSVSHMHEVNQCFYGEVNVA